MAWIATKRQKIKRDGKYIEVQPGTEVPEAEFWPNQQAHVDMGYIRWIPRDYAQPVKSAPVEVTAENTDKVEEEKPKKRGRPKKTKKKTESYFDAPAEE